MNRWDIINFFIEKHGYKKYLEIGYYKGWSFDQVICKDKVAVDPNPSKTPEQEASPYGSVALNEKGKIDFSNGSVEWVEKVVKLTSDELFRNFDDSEKIGKKHESFDIIFIDGLHEHHQVLRDLKHAFYHLSEGGVIIMHDCNPPEQAHTTTGDQHGNWTGTAYKAMLDLRNSPEAEAYVIDTDWGVGVVRPRGDLKKKDITDTEHFNAMFDWNYFSENRKKLLGLVDVSTFIAKERYNIVEIV